MKHRCLRAAYGRIPFTPCRLARGSANHLVSGSGESGGRPAPDGAEGATAPVNSQAQGTVFGSDTLERARDTGTPKG